MNGKLLVLLLFSMLINVPKCSARPGDGIKPCKDPLPGINCGRGGQACPERFTCVIHPADRFALCCPDAGMKRK